MLFRSNRLKETERELNQFRSAQALAQVSGLLENAKNFGDFKLLASEIGDGVSVEDLRTMALDIKNRLGESVVALASNNGGKPIVVVATSEVARNKGIKAGVLVKLASSVLGGGGGGKDDFAQGGGTNSAEIPNALKAIEKAIAK